MNPENVRLSFYAQTVQRGLLHWSFKPSQVMTVLLISRETYGAGKEQGHAEIMRWAHELRVSAFRLRAVLADLARHRVIDYDAVTGLVALLPDYRTWLLLNARQPEKNILRTEPLALESERPLSRALLENSQAECGSQSSTSPPPAAQGPVRGTWWKAVREKIELERNKISRNDQTEVVHQDPPLADGPENTGPPGFAEEKRGRTSTCSQYSPSLASLALVPKAKLATQAPGGAAIAAAPRRMEPMRPAAATEACEKEEAWKWLQQIDLMGHLKTTRSARQWQALCQTEPRMILKRFRGIYDADKRTLRDPLAYLSRICRDERRPGFV